MVVCTAHKHFKLLPNTFSLYLQKGTYKYSTECMSGTDFENTDDMRLWMLSKFIDYYPL